MKKKLYKDSNRKAISEGLKLVSMITLTSTKITVGS